MLGHITRHHPAACRMSDMNHICQVQRCNEVVRVRGIGIHVVASPGFLRPAMTAAVRCDHPIALGEKEQHLIVPVVSRQRPAMMEHDGWRLDRGPIPVEDLSLISRLDIRHADLLP